MTDVEYEALIEHLRQQIADLTAERDRLKNESANASEALMASNENNAELCTQLTDATEALALFGIPEEEEENNDNA